jgi:hypothetical protein
MAITVNTTHIIVIIYKKSIVTTLACKIFILVTHFSYIVLIKLKKPTDDVELLNYL